MAKQVRGISADVGSMDADQLVKSKWKRLHEWLLQPKNAAMVLMATIASCYLLAFMGAGIYVVGISFLLMKWFLKQPEEAPLKIPAQDKLIDLNELHPSTRKPTTGKGIFFLGNRTSDGKEIWLTNDDARQHFLVLGTTGAGKAIPVSSHVLTPQGWVKAGSIRVGDVITTPFSVNTKVTGVFPQGKRKLWTVTFSDGRTSRVDGNHLWEVHSSRWDKPRVLMTKDIATLSNRETYSIILVQPQEKPHVELDVAPLDMGLSIGLNQGFNGIPKPYLDGSITQRKELLKGLREAFGHQSHSSDNFSLSIPDDKLAQDIQALVWGLGGIAYKEWRETGYIITVDFSSETLNILDVKEESDSEDCVCFLVDHPRHLFVIDDYIATHNTELLMAIAANAISWGSGLIFVDGKGDIKSMGMLYAMARLWGRDADFLLLNFMPPPNKDSLVPGEIMSNTMNPYVTADADDIKQQIVGLMPESGGDGMWKDRAMTMLEAEVMALVWCRDNGILDLSLASLRKYILLGNLSSFLDEEKFPGMPEVIKENIKLYLSSLGNYDFTKPGDQQEADVAKQHSYLEMQLSGPFAALANQYGSIFNTDFGEVDMFDVVLNRRILIVLLPSLQKSSEDTERMGKIVVASLKSMMGATLGNLGRTADPTVLSLLEIRVTTSPSPFIVILDEVGYYTVSGMAVIAAQVRSLGFSMVYAAQDLKAMTRINEKEAQSIIANTNVKIIMRTEDADTMELAVKGGGRAARVRTKGYSINENSQPVFSGADFTPDSQKSVEFENRINELDLKGQDEGYFTLLYKDIIVRGRALYTAVLDVWDDTDTLMLAPNQFLTVRKPNVGDYESQKRLPKIVSMLQSPEIIQKQKEEEAKIQEKGDSDVNIAGQLFDVCLTSQKSRARSYKDLSCIVIGGLSVLIGEATTDMKQFVKQTRKGFQESSNEAFVPDDVVSSGPTQNTAADAFEPDEDDIGGLPIPQDIPNSDTTDMVNRASTTDEIRDAINKTTSQAKPMVSDELGQRKTDTLDIEAIMDETYGVEVNNDGIMDGDTIVEMAGDTRVKNVLEAVRNNIAFPSQDKLDSSAQAREILSHEVNDAVGGANSKGAEEKEYDVDDALAGVTSVSSVAEMQHETVADKTHDVASDYPDVEDQYPDVDGWGDIEEPSEGTKTEETETGTASDDTNTGVVKTDTTEENIGKLTGDDNLSKVATEDGDNNLYDWTNFVNSSET